VIENPAPEFRRRIQGTFEVPLYLTGNGGPGERFDLDADGLPRARRRISSRPSPATCRRTRPARRRA
jgi:hypothetical protein